MKSQNTKIDLALNPGTVSKPPVIVVMAGGTGGHVFPALAVAHLLQSAGYRVIWIGNRSGMEATLVPKHGFEMAWVRFNGLRGRGLLPKLLLPLNLLIAFAQAFAILWREKPCAVAGFGGYISFPGGMMAVLQGRPLVLHEQNAVAGLANKVLAKVANARLCAFPNALDDARWTGNPVRAEIVDLAAPDARFAERNGPLKLLVVGGSLGAQRLNEVVPQALALLDPSERPQVIHQSGANQIDALKSSYAQAGVSADARAFIDDMAAAYGEADFVICRAGAMTVSEIACAGVAALFVPFPFAVDDHQTANAQFLAAQGAAMLTQQSELSAASLADTLRSLTRAACLAMAQKARALARPDAARVVADTCLELAVRA
jgi:UDP-N-acetylglucosamine--N-acetylmuramyl-(pentapeptide) pyrophosphoryl-undecaprenol N-acetylglucosamine transferase